MHRKSNSFYDEYIVSISKFLFIYYNIEGKDLNKLSHLQIKDMLSISSLSNDSIEVDDVMLGKTILVKDSEGIVLGYSNPLVSINMDDEERTSCLSIEFDNRTNDFNFNINDIDDYSEYELEELIKTCKKNKDEKTKCLIIKELRKRKSNLDERKTEKIEKIKKLELRKEW